MRVADARRPRIPGFLLALLCFGGTALSAQEKPPAEWDTTKARGQTRDIDFDTSEGTWMALDQSPDGKWIAFDLLGHIYRMPASGGKAESLTQDSGVALNMQPRYSPDGKTIAFISDRKGQNNLWLMDADGKNPRAVFTDKTQRALSPIRAWKAALNSTGRWFCITRPEVPGSSLSPRTKPRAGIPSLATENFSISMCKFARRFPSATPTRCSAVRNCAA